MDRGIWISVGVHTRPRLPQMVKPIRYTIHVAGAIAERKPGIIFDFNEQGRIVGMEFLNANKDLPMQVLAEAA